VTGHDGSKREDEEARNSRRLLELLQEIRVATAGVQILFGFLLAVPFQQGFQKVTSFERNLYLAVLGCAALSAVFLIAPTSMHRLLTGRGHKPWILAYANWMVIGGLILLALAMVGVVLLLTHAIFGPAAAIAMAVPLALAFALTWFVIPILRRGERVE
jgi:hypothetical protein